MLLWIAPRPYHRSNYSLQPRSLHLCRYHSESTLSPSCCLSSLSIVVMSLPIQNSTKPCLLDPEHVRWFADKLLYSDADGVYFHDRFSNRSNNTGLKKYYVHDNVMAIALKDGLTETWLDRNGRPDITGMRRFVRARCMPTVQDYYFAR